MLSNAFPKKRWTETPGYSSQLVLKTQIEIVFPPTSFNHGYTALVLAQNENPHTPSLPSPEFFEIVIKGIIQSKEGREDEKYGKMPAFYSYNVSIR